MYIPKPIGNIEILFEKSMNTWIIVQPSIMNPITRIILLIFSCTLSFIVRNRFEIRYGMSSSSVFRIFKREGPTPKITDSFSSGLTLSILKAFSPFGNAIPTAFKSLKLQMDFK